jgi:membrane-bound lytic murein transglycosylase A
MIACLVALAVLGFFLWRERAVPSTALRVTPVRFSDLPGWRTNDPGDALAAFDRSCGVVAHGPAVIMGGAGYAGNAGDWLPACHALPQRTMPAAQARAWFEAWFTPLAVTGPTGPEGLFTAYYEPQLSVSRRREGRYSVPIYGRPSDLVTADLGQFRHALAGTVIAGRLSGSRLVPYPARAQIDASGLPTAPILAYADDPVTVFFLHIQGSGRALFPDGTQARLGYAGNNGQPYTPIGRVLAERGELARSTISLQTIRGWLHAHPGTAAAVMETDRSYVFFAEAPLGDPALGSPGTEHVPLTPGASLAVDPRLHPLGVPVFVATTAPDPDPVKPDRGFTRLLIAQDTGGAIRGAVRGDVFLGFGPTAESVAGRMKSQGRIYVLVPKPLAVRLSPYRDFGTP